MESRFFSISDVASVAGVAKPWALNAIARGRAETRDGDTKGGNGRSYILSEATARWWSLAFALANSGVPAVQAFRASRILIEECPANQFKIGDKGGARRMPLDCRAPGHPFVTGRTLFACRLGGPACLINVADFGLIDATAVSSCLGGERRSGVLLVDVSEIAAGFEAMKVKEAS